MRYEKNGSSKKKLPFFIFWFDSDASADRSKYKDASFFDKNFIFRRNFGILKKEFISLLKFRFCGIATVARRNTTA